MNQMQSLENNTFHLKETSLWQNSNVGPILMHGVTGEDGVYQVDTHLILIIGSSKLLRQIAHVSCALHIWGPPMINATHSLATSLIATSPILTLIRPESTAGFI